MDTANIIALAGLGIGLLGHMCATIWWAAKITTLLGQAQIELRDMASEMKAVNKTYVTKEEYAKDQGHTEKRLDAVWAKVDKLTEKSHGQTN